MKRMLIRCMLLGLIMLIFLVSASPVFKPDDYYSKALSTQIPEFYNLPENSLDVLLVGASTIHHGLIPLEMWHNYGFTAFSRASAAQSPAVSYYVIEEMLKYQHPSLVALDVAGFYSNVDPEQKAYRSWQVLEHMRFSTEKYKLIQYVLGQIPARTWGGHLFPFLTFHSRWNELTQADYDHSDTLATTNKGFYSYIFWVEKVVLPEEYMQKIESPQKISHDSEKYYRMIIELCRQNGIEVLLMTMPREDWSYSKHLGVQHLADQYNLGFIDYNLPENFQAVGIDLLTDFYNPRHLNYQGAQKITAHLGSYIQQSYHLPDHKGDPAYVQWDIDLQKFLDEYERALQEYEAAQEKAGK